MDAQTNVWKLELLYHTLLLSRCDKNWGLKGNTFFFLFLLKNTDAIRMVPKIYVYSKKNENDKKYQLKIVIFTAIRYHSILNRHVTRGSSFEQTMMGWSPQCCLPSFLEIGLPVPDKKIFNGFLP